ncbi:flagellar biosynthetic protein FlhB [bacterium BMS3Bbin06]|nr:flagellar biosynthetic protein FlhB [bacterium BMS3Abin08]GBE33823.1 flagellar biosynthetic protein FlhB [bacterium BMS3Bbin06]HDO35759.1 flagellar biosynthesis protein FlhB [Nitrospirota bacterium]HDY70574.1 flagellar biosynthesis protein FlhB [Nitrospirota bacterium]
MAEDQEKTEQATPRRRQKAREEGEVARSKELTSMISMSGVLIVLTMMGGYTARKMLALTRDGFIIDLGRNPMDVLLGFIERGMGLLLPFLLFSLVMGIAGNVIQGGFVFKPLKLSLGKFNPMEGVKRLFSKNAIIEFFKGLVKFTIGAVLLYLMIRGAIPAIGRLIMMDISSITVVMSGLILHTLKVGFICFLVISVLDYISEQWKYEQSLKMSSEEIKEEYKQTEGNPQVKSRIRSIQRDLARQRMMQEVPRATVVITNPTHLAVALKYEKGETDAPKIVAKGADYLAQRIRETARKSGVPIMEDRPLAQTLYKLEIGTEIPQALYRAVAKILAYIYKLRESGA